ncbi:MULTISPECIES: MlaD family protein [Polaribacter]|uniref:ABC transporter substrate-binding protein n=1 Tax=Polaribacter sejongensis TaxID=985043 RepID=A0AAJ1VH60_9FLAO|nr:MULTISPECIES: MlaD family protein [Polaribacter]AUC22686.1 ABC transporter substrate-binding protein [Polaribacter sejongensis]MDN3619047.1 MlaD family protein [Polaribacter undariae]UWD33133.1 MlaD family protein [Polaribacter undariae]
MSKELKTGIVAIVIIFIFIWGYNFLKGQNLFDGSTRYFKVEYTNIGGLTESSSVTINGLKVGKVIDIAFNKSNDKKGQLVVNFAIEKDFDFSKKSIVKIYSPSPLGGSNLAIIPNYEGEMAVSGDYLKGEIESSLFTSIGERLDPIQAKLETVMVRADSLFKNVNNILDTNTQNSLKNSVSSLEATLNEVNKMMSSVNGMIDATSSDLKASVKNTKTITENFAKVSDTLANADIGRIVKKAEHTLTSVNTILEGINSGKGTIGKLITDEAMYTNLENASKELEELLREMKLNPKRFVHFSLFGKKAKPYTPTEDDELDNEENN